MNYAKVARHFGDGMRRHRRGGRKTIYDEPKKVGKGGRDRDENGNDNDQDRGQDRGRDEELDIRDFDREEDSIDENYSPAAPGTREAKCKIRKATAIRCPKGGDCKDLCEAKTCKMSACKTICECKCCK